MADPTALTQDERRAWLIRALLAEDARFADIAIPSEPGDQRELLRALMNVREPRSATSEFLAMQDAYLQERNRERGIVPFGALTSAPHDPHIRLWRGDITTLAVDAITNAANDQMLGCFVPGHHCIDNAIHTFAGVQLRRECARIMGRRGRPEPTGTATVTPAYNLPSSHVIHTVGPIVAGPAPTPRDEAALRSCYRSVLDAARDLGAASVALCCISTGVFRYPNAEAARVAVDVVRTYLQGATTPPDVVFNVFLERDEALYRALLGMD